MARSVIDGLSSNDAAAVIFTSDNWNGQNFTTDHPKLIRATETMNFGRRVHLGLDCAPLWGATLAVRDAVEALSSIPKRRKVVFYIGAGIPIHMSHDMQGCYDRAQMNLREAVSIADRSNVNVYGLDASGLKVYAGLDDAQIEFLRDISSQTGDVRS